MKYLLLIAALTQYGQAPISVIEFGTYKACDDEKKAISLWFKMQKFQTEPPHMDCLSKADGEEHHGK